MEKSVSSASQNLLCYTPTLKYLPSTTPKDSTKCIPPYQDSRKFRRSRVDSFCMSDFVLVSSNPQGDESEAESDNLDILSTFSLTESEAESEDEQPFPSIASPSLLRRVKKSHRSSQSPLPRPSSPILLSRHRQLSLSKRAVSAPCRVPLTSRYRSRRSTLTHLPDSDTDMSDVSETSVPAPYTAGVLASNPNNVDADTPHSALLRNRVDRIRAMKLDGSIISYIDRCSWKGKVRGLQVGAANVEVVSDAINATFPTPLLQSWQSIVEKLSKDEETLKLFMKGHGLSQPAQLSQPTKKPAASPPLTKEQRLALVPKKLLDVVQRVCLSPESHEYWSSLELFFIQAFAPSTENPPTPPPITKLSTNITSTSTHNTKLTFSMPVKEQNGAFVRIFVHALSHYHGLNSRSYVNSKFKAKVVEVTGQTCGLDASFLSTIKSLR